MIQAGPLSRTRQQSRRLTIARVDGLELLLTHPLTRATVTLWHHRPLTPLILPGDTVGLCEPKKLMLAGRDLISVRQTGDLGPLATDEVTDPAGIYIIDLASGRGLSVR